ncbi:hypothetical protein H9L13_01310 [Sphingomonas lutea]|uniref:Uncharacterized protein n=1 Tax=Sphingomonas lutea TaxID=1045317 RepID=A0A7G9SIF0_9SPHN|nr:hypothetical protein [Sphingomonas lutea]QNN67625.1 hypothetical protein H9L13_01310 [Sphingomonas lutea]
MTRTIDHKQLAASARIVPAPALPQRACEEHSFELPTRLYAALALCLFGFLAVMTIGFAAPMLAVPMGINFIFLAAFFAVPVIFVRTSKDKGGAMRWSEFARKGVDTATGHSSAAEASVLMLTLPVLILCWSIAVVVIAAVL